MMKKSRKLIYFFYIAGVTESDRLFFMRGHLITEPGRGERVIQAAARWFEAKRDEMKVDPSGVHMEIAHSFLDDIKDLPAIVGDTDDIAAFLPSIEPAESILTEIQYLGY